MAEVKGKFITLAGILASESPEAISKIDNYLLENCSLNHLELDPEDFYDTKLFDEVINIYASSFPNPIEKVIYLGKRVYPTIKRTVGLPTHLSSPKDFILFEAEGFRLNHSSDVVPRKILDETDNSITMYAPAPGYDENLFIGVWLGILEMVGITTGKVEALEDSTYKISW